MKTLKLSLDYEELKGKSQQAIASVRKRIAKQTKEVTLTELKEAIEKGQTFCPATFEGERATNDAFKSQQLFALDFDNGITIQEFMTKAEELRLMPFMIYTSFSHTEELHKFRALYYFENELTNKSMRKAVQITLMKIFEECDNACKDASRQFYGTNKHSIYFNKENVLLFENLLFAISTKLKESSHGLRDMKSWLKSSEIAEYNKNPLILMKDMPKQFGKYTNIYYSPKFEDGIDRMYDHYIVIFEKSYDQADFAFLDTKDKKEVDFKEVESKCALIERSLTGEEWLFHNQIFGLATNLAKMKGGKTIFQNIVKSRPEYSAKGKSIEIIYNQVNKENYAPMRCSNFCPYYESCKNTGINILHVTNKSKNNITQIKEIVYKDINDIYAEMREDIFRIINNPVTEDGVYLIKAPTGAGKTTAIIDVLRSTEQTITFAFPTHRLKEEVSEKMKHEGIRHLTIASQPVLQDEEVQGKINFLNMIGASTESQKIFRKMAEPG